MKRIPSNAHILACIIILAALYAGSRLIGLESYVTTDEPLWLGRSANFYRALQTGDFVHTYQMAHPGVLTMWAGAAAYWVELPDWATLYPNNINQVILIDEVLRNLDIDPLRMMISARIAKILLQTLFFGVSLAFIWRLFGPPVLVVSGALIAFDPFLSGLDSVLHVDGLFAIVCFAAILALAHAVRSGHTTMAPWIVAGILAACAWMQRSTGIVLVVVLIGCLAVSVLQEYRQSPEQHLRERFQTPAFSGMLWGGTALVTSIALLPALWVDPFGTMGAMWNWSSDAATGGHELPAFFNGRIVYGDPGPTFYPTTLLWRLTPVTLVGLVAFAAIFTMRLSRWKPPTRPVTNQAESKSLMSSQTMATIAVLASFAALIVLGMTLGAKKFDRYVLPVYPILDLFAALGFVGALSLLPRRLLAPRLVLPAVASILLVGQAWATASVLPWRLDYYNPLFGGATAAEMQLQMGWGQGAGDALDWIEQQLEPGDTAVIQGSGARSPYAYLLPDDVTLGEFGLDTPAGWYETDFLLIGIQQWQRDISPAYRLVRDLDPVHVIEVNGVPYFKVYAPRRSPLPAALQQPTACSFVQIEGLQLAQIIGRDASVDFYWLSLESPPPGTATITVTFVPLDEANPAPVIQSTATWRPTTTGTISKATVPLPDDNAPDTIGTYWLDITVTPVDTNGTELGSTVARTTSECYYQPAKARSEQAPIR